MIKILNTMNNETVKPPYPNSPATREDAVRIFTEEYIRRYSDYNPDKPVPVIALKRWWSVGSFVADTLEALAEAEQKERQALQQEIDRLNKALDEGASILNGYLERAEKAERLLQEREWVSGLPDDCATYIFRIEFMGRGKPMEQLLIGSISEETGELLDHDGEPTGWDNAEEVITHYMLLPEPPKTTEQ